MGKGTCDITHRVTIKRIPKQWGSYTFSSFSMNVRRSSLPLKTVSGSFGGFIHFEVVEILNARFQHRSRTLALRALFDATSQRRSYHWVFTKILPKAQRYGRKTEHKTDQIYATQLSFKNVSDIKESTRKFIS